MGDDEDVHDQDSGQQRQQARRPDVSGGERLGPTVHADSLATL